MLEKLPDTIGKALRNQRAGLEKITFNQIELPQGVATIELTSSAFPDHAPIPRVYTADGEAISPPLQWRHVPPNAKSLLLIVEDADAPTPQPLVHAIAVDLAPVDGAIEQGALNSVVDGGDTELKTGRNSLLQRSWLAPDPPPGHGEHRYAFQIFALANSPDFSSAPGREEVQTSLRDHAMASGLLIGTYERDTAIPDRDAALVEPIAPA